MLSENMRDLVYWMVYEICKNKGFDVNDPEFGKKAFRGDIEVSKEIKIQALRELKL